MEVYRVSPNSNSEIIINSVVPVGAANRLSSKKDLPTFSNYCNSGTFSRACAKVRSGKRPNVNRLGTD